jgi:hypothetical protein
MKNKILAYTLTLILVAILGSLLVTPAGAQDNPEDHEGPCHDCHNVNRPDGDYIFEPLNVHASTPRVVNPGANFEHQVVIDHPGEYTVESVTVQLDLEDALEVDLIGKRTLNILEIAEGRKIITFQLRAQDTYQSQRIKTIVTYLADYHYEPTEYTEIVDISITIDEIHLQPSTWSVDMRDGDERVVKITAQENVQNVRVVPSTDLENAVSISYPDKSALTKDESFSVKIKAKDQGIGKLNLVCEDQDGDPHKITVDVSISESKARTDDFWVWAGMATGITSWVFLIFASLIGVPFMKYKPLFNKIFGNAQVRKELHCGICYTLLILALLHAVIVMSKHWFGAMMGDTFIFADFSSTNGLYVNLGSLSWFSMVVVSLTGTAFKPLIKKLKYNTWRWTHNIITIIALILALTHGSILLYFRFF